MTVEIPFFSEIFILIFEDNGVVVRPCISPREDKMRGEKVPISVHLINLFIIYIYFLSSSAQGGLIASYRVLYRGSQESHS